MIDGPPATKVRSRARIWWGLLFVVVILLTGAIVYPAITTYRERGKITRVIHEARQIITALRIYSSDHNGEYPDSLDVLVRMGFLPESLLYDKMPDESLAARWVLLPGVENSSPGTTPVIVGTQSERGKLILGMNDSSIVQERGELRSFLEKRGLSMPKPPAEGWRP